MKKYHQHAEIRQYPISEYQYLPPIMSLLFVAVHDHAILPYRNNKVVASNLATTL